MLSYMFLSILISFIITSILGIVIIPYLKKLKINQSLSIYLEEKHKSKKNTPTMGGLIFIIGTLLTYLLFYLLNIIEFNYTVFLIIFPFLGYFLIGFIDDYLIVIKHNNKGLSENQKLILQIIISVIYFYIFMVNDNEPLIWIHTLNIKVNIGFLYGIFILFVLLSSSNAVNITDGLDGLACGLSIISFITFGILSYNTEWLIGYNDISLLAFIISGSLLAFLVFNINPAKVFMGDTGSLALGATLGSYAILTRHELLLVLIGIVFVIETLSCIIQRTYYKVTKKRLFPMTPIHHTFEKMGISEINIVRIFWIIGLLSSILALSFGVFL